MFRKVFCTINPLTLDHQKNNKNYQITCFAFFGPLKLKWSCMMWVILKKKVQNRVTDVGNRIRGGVFSSHHCNSPYGASGRCTRVLSTCYLTDTEHCNTPYWSNEYEQARESMWCNVNGVKDCKKTIIPSIVSILRKFLTNELKQSRKYS